MTKTEALEKLNNLLTELKDLPEFVYSGDNNIFDKWHRKAERHIKNIFNNKNSQSTEFCSVRFKPTVYSTSNVQYNINNSISAHNNGRNKVKTLIEAFIEEVEEWSDDIVKVTMPKQISSTNNSNKIFIVHGHDELIISQVSEVLRKLGLEPIILKDEVNNGNTIIEKIERLSNDVGFGIVLYTACDVGGKDEKSLNPRARQNVVLEHGYLMAKIGRKNTMALVKDKIEIPSDLSGLGYTAADENKAWQYKLVDELKASGYNVSKDSI
ncbi:nucleotide-binding protein [Aliarcobacter butzleri]|uniref:nucleotide-binding protein n=1 Tax=Aliarcobacter butzleri TaxID=28197 RepID=UPI00263D2858|nr:nucleotide-binding protein [Aliarcobacter butzleri]MDN5091020.1 nucleotide-binding protein [Aliarcobacter butzleri]